MTPTPFGSAAASARRWTLVATILGSSLTFIDGTVVNVALPALQTDLARDDHRRPVGDRSLCAVPGRPDPRRRLDGRSVGPQTGLPRGRALFTLASVACGLAGSPRRSSLRERFRAWARRSWCPAASRSSARRSTMPIVAGRSGHGPDSARSPRRLDRCRWLADRARQLARRVLPQRSGGAHRGHPVAPLHEREPRRVAHVAIDWTGAPLAVLGLGGVVFGLIEWPPLGRQPPARRSPRWRLASCSSR